MCWVLNGAKHAIQDEYQATLEGVRHGRTGDWAGNMRSIGWLDGVDRMLAVIEEVERKSGLGEGSVTGFKQ
jgi:hypothetical protein